MKTSVLSSLGFWSLLLLILLPERSRGAYIFGYLLHNPIPDLESSNSLSDRMLSDQAANVETTTPIILPSSIVSPSKSTPNEKESKKDKVRKKNRRLKKKHNFSSTTSNPSIVVDSR
jgi:hypothetical protein